MSAQSPSRTGLVLGVIAGILAATLFAVLSPSGPAAAHGNVTGPASRNYGCYERWGSDFQNPRMATEDPMCWQAWQADPNAMWNWNGLYREGVAGNHQAAIPDGQLCSGGRTENGRYAAMDVPGNWRTTALGNSFRVRLLDGAGHGADYLRVYVTKPGFNPQTTALRWSDLDLVAQLGNTPLSQWTPTTGGWAVEIPVSLSGRSDRAMVYTIWQASHADQSYYFCSDVTFGGGGTTPTTPPPSNPPPSNPPSAGCTASYTLASQWQGGYQADVTVTAGSAAIRSWRVNLAYGTAPTVSQSWNATVAAAGGAVTASNASYNGALAAGGRTSFGFIAAGTPATPALTCTATG